MNRTFALIPLFLLLPLALFAEGQRIYLGRIDLAGLPPAELPALGEHLHYTPSEHALTFSEGHIAGYIPAVFRAPIRTMRENGVHLTFHVRHRYAHPTPGKYLDVDIWAETKDESRIRPLTYRVRTLPTEWVAGRTTESN